MRRAAYVFVVAMCLAATASEAHAQAKTIRMPTAAGSECIFSILLPKSYETSKSRYPVVYLFHGGGQDHTAFMARTLFPPMARKHEFIVVMPAADRNYSVLGPEAQGRLLDDRFPALNAFLLQAVAECHDQNAVLGDEANQRHKPDLRIDIERSTCEPQRSKRARHGKRNRDEDHQRIPETFELRGENEINEGKGQDKDEGEIGTRIAELA